MADGLKEWAHVAEQDKTVLAVKAHVGGALHTPQDAKWLVDEVDNRWVRLTYDFSHFQLRNYRLDESLKTMIDDAVFIHVKDTSGTADKFQFLLPGDGKIDYVAYFNQLKAHKYHGPVVVEVSGQIHSKPGYDPLQAARHSYDNLAPAFRQAGLRQATKPGRSAKP
jgi:inosose dehydratase